MGAAPPVLARIAALAEILPLRHAVLRPGRPLAAAAFAGDDSPEAVHVGAFLPSGAVVGCASLLVEPLEGRPARRLRGMATRADLRRRGVGRRVLALAEACAWTGAEPPLLWCHARLEAVPFYRRHGWEVVAPPFDIPAVGPHHTMVKGW